ncbi:MAG: YeeE/YedE family protein [Acinetobacter sp.]|jgi:uncharacterized membrane protein YedE/YeeE|nr:MAG: YeeE/YedE family protein [Acinetobacter sp.]
MHDFIFAFIGGTLLGASTIGYLYINGRIAGISGIIAYVMTAKEISKSPALYFLLGLLLVPFVYQMLATPQIVLNSSPIAMLVAGLLVGIGTRMGSGCTSGHGICGISRLSVRSIVATATFMLMGFVTVFVMRHVIGG